MWAVVVNPHSGRGLGRIRASEVTNFLDARELSYVVIVEDSAGKLRDSLDKFLDRESACEGVISVGGDGLAHLILQCVVPRNIPFAVVPAGTGNDFVRTLGWSLDNVENLLTAVVTTSPTRIDLGCVDSEWFGAILSTGFDSVVNERANALAWPKGPQRYNAAIALELPRFKPKSYAFTIDNTRFETEAMLIAVGNGKSYGGGMHVTPQAKIDDGLFDITILKPVSKLEFLKVFPTVYSGTHINHPSVVTYRGAKVLIEADAIAYADGERIGPAPISAECVRGAGLTWKI
jgi:diacylglycerol kinase (ATP)